MTIIDTYKITRLGNGFVRVDDRVSGLVGLYMRDGRKRSGNLRLPAHVVEAIRWEARI